MNNDVRAWIGDGLTIEAMAGDCIVTMARAVLAAFWAKYPEHKTEDEAEAVRQLETMAAIVGADNYQRLIGGSIVRSSGAMALELVPV